MERKLKERVTGAALLVVAGVVLIPWILDGQVDPGRVDQGLVIPPPGGASSGVRTIVLNADRETTSPTTPANTTPRPSARAPAPVEVPARSVAPDVAASPAPADREPASPPPAPANEPKVEAPAPERVAVAPAPVPARTVVPDPASGWAVQVGSFASESNARKLADQLVALDYRAFVSRKTIDGRPMFRVRVGPRATREEAATLAERLKADRQPVRIVEHPG